MYITYNIIYMGAAREPARGGCAHGSSHVVALLLEWAAAERPLGTSVLHNFGRPSFPFHPFPFTNRNSGKQSSRVSSDTLSAKRSGPSPPAWNKGSLSNL